MLELVEEVEVERDDDVDEVLTLDEVELVLVLFEVELVDVD